MAANRYRPVHALLGASTLALVLAAGPSLAETIFTPTAGGFTGYISASGPENAPIYAGTQATIEGEDLTPGQQITLMRGPTVLNPGGPLTVGEDGTFKFDVTVDEEAAVGLQPVVVIAENPAAATVLDLKVSPKVPLSGEDKFDVLSQHVTRGLYQVIYSEGSDALFVTAAVGRPPVKESTLAKVNAGTLETIASVTPGAAPAREDGSDGGLFAVYGVAVDDTHGNVWVTTTRQDSAAVYRQDDLSLVKQFDPDTVAHPRDVVIDEGRGRAYLSTSFTKNIEVFDTATLEQLEPIEITTEVWGEEFGARSTDLDIESGKLFSASISTPEVAVIDLDSGDVRVLPAPGLKDGSDTAYDRQEGLIFAVGQGSDNLLIIKEETGELLHDVKVGASPLSVAFEPVSRLAFVANRGAGTITVVDTSGEIVANLDAGSYTNQLSVDGKGNVFATNKLRGENDENGDRVWRIRAAG